MEESGYHLPFDHGWFHLCCKFSQSLSISPEGFIALFFLLSLKEELQYLTFSGTSQNLSSKSKAMSPHLFFVLAMEVFSGLMTSMVEEGKLKFDWKCDKERITHLCFADDLMIFYRGESYSVSRVAGCLQQFKDLSGLSPNPEKSHLFTSGVPAVVKEELLNIL